MAATLLAMPVSTTHALVGALAGAAVGGAGISAVSWTSLGSSFLLPLVASPLCAAAVVAVAYPLLRRARARMGVEHDTCVCVVSESGLVPLGTGPTLRAAVAVSPALTTVVAPKEVCMTRYRGRVMGIDAGKTLDLLHYGSGAAVSFARGLNDTPKIAALMLAGAAVPPWAAMASIGLGMAAGAWLQAAKVGRTMSFDITPMNPGQGFTASLTTAALVLGASRFGLPVSTTHVSVGALFGLGITTKEARGRTIRKIVLAWLATLPAAFVVALVIHLLVG
jgi:PiT family inorganic phosphate transporter